MIVVAICRFNSFFRGTIFWIYLDGQFALKAQKRQVDSLFNEKPERVQEAVLSRRNDLQRLLARCSQQLIAKKFRAGTRFVSGIRNTTDTNLNAGPELKTYPLIMLGE